MCQVYNFRKWGPWQRLNGFPGIRLCREEYPTWKSGHARLFLPLLLSANYVILLDSDTGALQDCRLPAMQIHARTSCWLDFYPLPPCILELGGVWIPPQQSTEDCFSFMLQMRKLTGVFALCSSGPEINGPSADSVGPSMSAQHVSPGYTGDAVFSSSCHRNPNTCLPVSTCICWSSRKIVFSLQSKRTERMSTAFL